MDKIEHIISNLWNHIGDQKKGLPEEVFEMVASLTPMVNVDLMVKDKDGRILLAWRDDEHCGKGWHVPGGIIRFKETREERLQKVALSELGSKVSFDKIPLMVREIIMPQTIRGHFISFLYRCYLSDDYMINNHGKSEHDAGYLKWHDEIPNNMVSGQREIYTQANIRMFEIK